MKTFTTILLLLLNISIYGQSKTKVMMETMTPEVMEQIVIDKPEFLTWSKMFWHTFESEAMKIDGDHDLLCMVSIKHEGDLFINLSARPKINDTILNNIKKRLSSLDTINTKYMDFSFLMMARINEGGQQEMIFEPKPIAPLDMEFEHFHEMSLKEKKEHLVDLAQNHLIPVIDIYASSMDSKLTNVHDFMEQLKDSTLFEQDIDLLTYYNPVYWEANMEVDPNNQIMLFTKACMHLAQGEITQAKRLLFLTHQFSDSDMLSELVHKELYTKVSMYLHELDKEIEEIAVLYDEKKFDEALVQYDSLIKNHYHSPKLHYYRYHTRIAALGGEIDRKKEWSQTSIIIYDADPMYSEDLPANNGIEAYRLARRQQIDDLFEKEENFTGDMLNYADIALDLDNHGFAAQLYWLIHNNFSKAAKDDRDIRAHYLYCLEPLKVKNIKKRFKYEYDGRIKNEFKYIESTREALMYDNLAYQAYNY